jgi:hypothetical protein
MMWTVDYGMVPLEERCIVMFICSACVGYLYGSGRGGKLACDYCAFQGEGRRRTFLTFVWRNQTESGRDESPTQIRDSKSTSSSSINGHARDLHVHLRPSHITLLLLTPAPNCWSAHNAVPSHQSHYCIPPAAIGCATAFSG